MLGSQNFGRSHHAGLESVVQGNQHGHQGHQSLSTSHVSLQQPVHLPPAAHVATHFLDDTFLSPRQLKRQVMGIKSIENLAYMLEHQSPELIAAFLGVTEDVKLHIEQFLEFQPILCLAEKFWILRKMNVI